MPCPSWSDRCLHALLHVECDRFPIPLSINQREICTGEFDRITSLDFIRFSRQWIRLSLKFQSPCWPGYFVFGGARVMTLSWHIRPDRLGGLVQTDFLNILFANMYSCSRFPTLHTIWYKVCTIQCSIDSTRRYGPLRGRTSSSCRGLRPSGKKRAYYSVLAHFRPF